MNPLENLAHAAGSAVRTATNVARFGVSIAGLGLSAVRGLLRSAEEMPVAPPARYQPTPEVAVEVDEPRGPRARAKVEMQANGGPAQAAAAAADGPSSGQAGELRLQRRGEARDEESVGAAVRVDEPWDGYAQMTVAQVVARLKGAGDAERAIVRLYETQGRARKGVLRATEG